MRAWIKRDGKLRLEDAAMPAPSPGEMLVKIEAISLNRGEVRGAARAADGTIPGWDIAGTVVTVAASGKGPPSGSRVVAILHGGGWAEYASVPVTNSAVIPDEVSFAAAATLPVAGLTVLRAFAVGGALLGKRVLITGASGGVGLLAIQIAKLGGASVTGVRAAGDDDARGSYDLILESVGGSSLARSIELVAPGGVVVSIGNSSEGETTFNARTLYAKGGASLYGLLIFEEVASRRIGARELAHLLELVRTGALRPEIQVERDWRELDDVLADLENRRFSGKAVLRVT